LQIIILRKHLRNVKVCSSLEELLKINGIKHWPITITRLKSLED